MSLMPLDEVSIEAYASHPSDPVDLKRQAITLLLSLRGPLFFAVG